MSIYQSIPKFKSMLGGRPVYIPAVLFHFPQQHLKAVAERLEKELPLPVGQGVCYTLRTVFEGIMLYGKHQEAEVLNLTYGCVDRALMIQDLGSEEPIKGVYLGCYFNLKQGITRDSYSDEELSELRTEWVRHIKHHLKEQA